MDIQSERPRLIAHRGWPTRFPENSLPSFAAAIAAKADEIELDVWCSRDYIPFVCHDPTVDRTSDHSGRHDHLTMEQLESASLLMPDGTVLPGMGFPTLEEVLDLIAGRLPINIHVKDPGPDGLIIRELRDYYGGQRPACGTYIAGDMDVLQASLDIAPELPRCCLAGQHDGSLLLRNALDTGCERIQFPRAPRPEDVSAALDAGLITNLFWSDDGDEIARLFRAGILAPLTNDVGPVRQRLVELELLR